MFRTALRNVLAHKARLLMTVLAVMLGVAFVSGTLVFTSTLSDAFRNSAQKSLEHVDVAVQPPSSDAAPGAPEATPQVDGKLLGTVARVPGATTVTGLVSGYTGVADKHGKLLGAGLSTRGSNYFPGKNGKDARYPMRDGAAPKGPDQIALDARTADTAGYRVGDTVRISVDGPVRKPKLTGIFTTDDDRVAAGGTLTLFDTKSAQKLFRMPGAYSVVQVTAAAGTSQNALQHAIERALPPGGATVETGKQLADQQADMIEQQMDGMKTGLMVFAGISLFVGIFLIANTFTMLVAQRTRELALLRAVGAARRQVTRSVLIEAFVVGTIAGATGLVAGIGVGAGLRALISSTAGKLPDGPLVVSPATVLTALAVGIVVTVLAAWLPGRRAAKTPPVAAMNSVHAPATTKSLVVRNSIGAAFAGLGIAGVLAATGMDDGRSTMGAGAVLLLIGVFILTPLLSRPLIALAVPVLRAFGIAGTLARQNALRNPRRTATTASALMVGLTLITGLTVIATSVQKGVDKLATDSLKADYVISMDSGQPFSTQLEKAVDAADGVAVSSPLRKEMAETGDGPAVLNGVNGREFGALTQLNFTEGALGELRGNRTVVDGDTARDKHWKTGSRVPMTFPDGKKATLTVSGVYEGNDMFRGFVLDNATLAPHQKHIADDRILVKMAGGATDGNKDALAKALGNNPAVLVADKKDVSDGISHSITVMLNMLYGLLAMAVIVAVLGVVNTLAMSVFERSQEIGMLRAIGLDRRGVKRMVRLESLVISLFGGVLGVGLGVFFGWAAGELIGAAMPSYELVLPWGRMGLFLGLAALVGVLAALWPARRAARLNMLTALKAD
ncbi:putative ABC transport system permease protein [Streptomyces sp. 2112.3]|uniref:ABC transporter permease n=1 Tax=Streptomyces sp. 2112.3 TaxID=1881023 RepID=UPI000898681B|nr:ABC transporter permease [Streptomyces sp. 2112.3]SEE91423.1 putative ABC transport system permease protein [Streptomyces sp. 2112.3]